MICIKHAFSHICKCIIYRQIVLFSRSIRYSILTRQVFLITILRAPLPTSISLVSGMPCNNRPQHTQTRVICPVRESNSVQALEANALMMVIIIVIFSSSFFSMKYIFYEEIFYVKNCVMVRRLRMFHRLLYRCRFYNVLSILSLCRWQPITQLKECNKTSLANFIIECFAFLCIHSKALYNICTTFY